MTGSSSVNNSRDEIVHRLLAAHENMPKDDLRQLGARDFKLKGPPHPKKTNPGSTLPSRPCGGITVGRREKRRNFRLLSPCWTIGSFFTTDGYALPSQLWKGDAAGRP